MARVTGIGGVFLRARDPKALRDWYAKNLGIELSDYGGATFLWTDEVPATTGMTTWSLFPADTKYFGPGQQSAMINSPCSPNWQPPTSTSTPSAKTPTMAASPGSPTRRATASNSGSRSFNPRKRLPNKRSPQHGPPTQD
jgi:hypothetical protein